MKKKNHVLQFKKKIFSLLLFLPAPLALYSKDDL